MGLLCPHFKRLHHGFISNLVESDPQDKVKPPTGIIIEHVKSVYGEKGGHDLITQLTSGFNTGTEQVSEMIVMFLGRSEYIKRDIMKAHIKVF